MKLLKKLYLQPFVVMLTALLALSSCQPKDSALPKPIEENPSNPLAPQVLLKRISSSPIDFQAFDYDEKGNIIILPKIPIDLMERYGCLLNYLSMMKQKI